MVTSNEPWNDSLSHEASGNIITVTLKNNNILIIYATTSKFLRLQGYYVKVIALNDIIQ